MTTTDHDRSDDATPDEDNDSETEQVSDTGGDSYPVASTADSEPTRG